MKNSSLVRVGALLCCLHSASFASPVDLFGFGAESPAKAGTGVADASSYDSLFLNPAGLSRASQKRFTIGGQYGHFSLKFDGVRQDQAPPSGLLIGGTIPLTLGGWFKDRVGFGIGVIVPPSSVNKAQTPLPGIARFALLQTRSQMVAVHQGLGLKVSDNIRVGASVVAVATLEGQLTVQVDGAGRFATFSEQQLVAKLAPILGVQWALPKWNLDTGLVVRGPVATKYRIVVENELADVLPVTIPTVEIAGTSQYTPLTIALEGSWTPMPSLTANLQLQYQRWSAFPLPTENATAAEEPQEDPGFSDTVVPRLGLEWRALKRKHVNVAVRGGYSFIMTPAPEQSGRQSLLDNHRHLFSTGIGVALPTVSTGIYIDAWFQFQALAPRSHTKDLSRFLPDDRTDFFYLDTSGQIYVGGLSVGINF